MTGLPRSATAIAHGYTAADVYDLAVYAVRTDHWRPTIEWAERVEAAWSAISLALVEATEAPYRRELIHIGRDASADVIDGNMHHRGIDKRGATLGEQRVSFNRYWFRFPSTPLADRVVDEVALTQIWSQLKPDMQEALVMLAVHGDYSVAAQALGLQYYTFHARIKRARRQFFALWHEGEAPSSMWGHDRRQGRETSRTAVRVLAQRRRNRVAAQRGEAA